LANSTAGGTLVGGLRHGGQRHQGLGHAGAPIAGAPVWDSKPILEAEGYKYTIRLKVNAVLQRHISHLLKRPVGRPPSYVRRFYASFRYRAGSWSAKRGGGAKFEWHPDELYPRVGFIITNLARPADRVVVFYNQRGTAEQYIKEGKNAVKWTRLSCRTMKGNAVRLQLHALAYNLANFLRTPALPEEVASWSLTTIREKLAKIGAKFVPHARYAVFQMAEAPCRDTCSAVSSTS